MQFRGIILFILNVSAFPMEKISLASLDEISNGSQDPALQDLILELREAAEDYTPDDVYLKLSQSTIKKVFRPVLELFNKEQLPAGFTQEICGEMTEKIELKLQLSQMLLAHAITEKYNQRIPGLLYLIERYKSGCDEEEEQMLMILLLLTKKSE